MELATLQLTDPTLMGALDQRQLMFLEKSRIIHG